LLYHAQPNNEQDGRVACLLISIPHLDSRPVAALEAAGFFPGLAESGSFYLFVR